MANTPNSNTLFWVETLDQFNSALSEREENDIILVLSEKVPLSQIERPNCHYYDDLASLSELKPAIKQIEEYLESWFLQKDGKSDYSKINDVSIGLLFLPSIHYLYLCYSRYYLSLLRFLKLKQFHIKTFSNIHPCALTAVKAYSKQFSCNLLIEERGCFQIDRDEQYQIELDYQGRQRDLSNVFKPLPLTVKILSSMQSKLLSKRPYQTLLTQGNKIQSLLEHGFGEEKQNDFLYPIPKKELIKTPSNLTRGYLKINGSVRSVNLNKALSTEIEDNYVKKYKDDIFNLYFLEILKQKIFPFISPAMTRYHQYLSFFERVKVKKVVFTADSHEDNLLLAMATKKFGIQNILTPHGLYGYGYPLFKHGANQLFEEFIAFGKKDFDDYSRDGIPKEKIHIAPLPHFANYKKRTKDSQPAKALILPLEFSNIAIGS